MFLDRISVYKAGEPTVDRFGNERPGVPTLTPVEVPVSVQQRSSVEEVGGEYIHRVSSDYLVASQPGYLLDMVKANEQIKISGKDGMFQVVGHPVHYETPVKHSELSIKIVEG